MITRYGNLFHLETRQTSYIFRIVKSGHAEHLHYGKKLPIRGEQDGEFLAEKQAFLRGNTNVYDPSVEGFTLEDTCLEMSSLGRGDIRDPFISVVFENGSTTSDFVFDHAAITKGKEPYETLPASYDASGEVQHLTVTLKEKKEELLLELHYYVYEDCDVICRSAKLINSGSKKVRVERLMSTQVDFDRNIYSMTTFGGAWAREMKKTTTPLLSGRHVNESVTGTSSNRANNFVMIHEREAAEDTGACYGFHLIYSGNHYEAASVNSYGKLRFVAGIHPNTFSWVLEPGASFEAPESCMTFAGDGMNHMSRNLHAFIREHIVRGDWKNRTRPVLVNSWEAMYFKINEAKLLQLAKASAQAGAELFVLDDGWFGKRDNDTCSLGDWVENKKKLPNGLRGLGEKINGMGLLFGIWVEPEMVNVDSDLYHAHPEWAMDIPGREHSEGRNQRILDLGRADVQEYILECMTRVFSSANISYVKWDMNRTFTDLYSRVLPADRQGEALHRYYIGFYRVMRELTERFPQILFEGCASGGNRFDLGMLCYFPQIWASDDTDAICRAEIQNNYSYGYPLSVLGCHVSSGTNHQTLRKTPLQTRFDVAAFGQLGYELNLAEMPRNELQEIKEQISQYKEYRELVQTGTFYRGRSYGDSYGYSGVLEDTESGIMEWTLVSADRRTAAGMFLNLLNVPNSPSEIYYPKGLDEGLVYHFVNQRKPVDIMAYGELINMVAPIHIKTNSMMHRAVAKAVKIEGERDEYTVPGELLMNGVRLSPRFASTGLNEKTRHFPDFASRIYIMKADPRQV